MISIIYKLNNFLTLPALFLNIQNLYYGVIIHLKKIKNNMSPLRRFYLIFKTFPFIALTIFYFQLYAQQNGEISGIITSRETGEPLIGVNIIIEGTTLGASTDLDGKYLIRRIPPGTYSLRISGVGYATKIITDVSINGKPVELNISMTEETFKLQEVVVTAEMINSTESTLLAQRKRSIYISDLISAEQIKRTPDATSSDALRRVTGLTIVDNKFVFIRGINDRYNGTSLDGAPVASTSVGKKSFSFDMIHSNLLENSLVIKSATPDLPGDFSGGLVQLNTLDFPQKKVVKFNFSSSYNTNTTNNNILLSRVGKYDIIGFDDGTRKFPGKTDPIENAILAPNTWAPRNIKAPFNLSFSLSAGNRIDIGEENESTNQFGYVTALTYRNSYQKNPKIIDDWQVGRYNWGNKYENSILWGLLANLSYKFSGRNKISFKNNFDQSAEDEVTRYNSFDYGNSQEKIYTTINWTQRSIYTGQLSGEHEFTKLGGLSVQWRSSLSTSKREDPDRKEVTYYRNLDEPNEPFVAAVNKRSWAIMNERTISYDIDFEFPLSIAKLKFGGRALKNYSNYNIRYFNVIPDYLGGISDSLTTLPLEYIYSKENYGRGKFLFHETSKASDTYTGRNALSAGYLMFDIPFSLFHNKFRLVSGARVENSVQNVQIPKSKTPDSPMNVTELKNTDILPSINLTYFLNDFTNLRFAYYHSVNRPEIRELASTGFYDFVKYEIVGGNPNLKRAYIKNIDLRLETFPAIGEVFAFSIFQKYISNAIEEELIHTSTRTRTWFNSPKAINNGWEIEVRKSFGFLGEYFSNITLIGNYTRIHSSVEFENVEGNSENTIKKIKTRPLQGQSPYVINAGIFFREPYFRTTLNILYNKFGRRLETVGFLTSDIYEEPRDIIDMTLTQPLFDSFEIKFTIKNLGNRKKVLSQENRIYESTYSGRTYSIQMSYGF